MYNCLIRLLNGRLLRRIVCTVVRYSLPINWKYPFLLWYARRFCFISRIEVSIRNMFFTAVLTKILLRVWMQEWNRILFSAESRFCLHMIDEEEFAEKLKKVVTFFHPFISHPSRLQNSVLKRFDFPPSHALDKWPQWIQKT